MDPAVAKLSRVGPPEQRLWFVNSQPVAPRACPDPEIIPDPDARMEPTPHHERGRVSRLGISVTDEFQQHEAQLRVQTRYEGAVTRHAQSGGREEESGSVSPGPRPGHRQGGAVPAPSPMGVRRRMLSTMTQERAPPES